jgi:hypothetical protein
MNRTGSAPVSALVFSPTREGLQRRPLSEEEQRRRRELEELALKLEEERKQKLAEEAKREEEEALRQALERARKLQAEAERLDREAREVRAFIAAARPHDNATYIICPYALQKAQARIRQQREVLGLRGRKSGIILIRAA